MPSLVGSEMCIRDSLETFSPTANAASMRLLVALACKYNLELLHWDIEQAFVQSKLDHEVFMKLPPGWGSTSGKVVREQEFVRIEAGI